MRWWRTSQEPFATAHKHKNARPTHPVKRCSCWLRMSTPRRSSAIPAPAQHCQCRPQGQWHEARHRHLKAGQATCARASGALHCTLGPIPSVSIAHAVGRTHACRTHRIRTRRLTHALQASGNNANAFSNRGSSGPKLVAVGCGECHSWAGSTGGRAEPATSARRQAPECCVAPGLACTVLPLLWRRRRPRRLQVRCAAPATRRHA